MLSSDNDINICYRDHFLRLQSFVYFQIFGSKVLQLNQICTFSSNYTEDFPGVFKMPLVYCFERGLT
ncbi:hypothetical protein C0J52_11045 [Blattella germanica]|nr:hypothetical protein C0J52_11045 [Blattella germanica]